MHENAEVVLDYFKHKNYRQLIISAMEHQSLNKSVEDKNIKPYFEEISGIQDHYAASKVDNAKNMMAHKQINANETLLIGDTIHDHEVAEVLGCECVLIANGHQNEKRLKTTNRIVLNKLSDLKEYL